MMASALLAAYLHGAVFMICNIVIYLHILDKFSFHLLRLGH
jgi:hypothetical protein